MTNEATDAMTLAGQGSWCRLTILRYQFPENENDEWDSNWLIVDGRVSIEGREWQFRAPCLTTFEAMQLADWLDALAQEATQEAYCAFTEPNLQFDRVSSQAIRVSFALESAPPWAKQGDDWTKHGFEVLIGPSLAIAATHLRQQLSRFPERVSRRAETGRSQQS